MKLPGGSDAYVGREKIEGYLLSRTHATGRFKARCKLGTPGGTRVPIRTVWIREHGSEAPGFVTAYPG